MLTDSFKYARALRLNRVPFRIMRADDLLLLIRHQKAINLRNTSKLKLQGERIEVLPQ